MNKIAKAMAVFLWKGRLLQKVFHFVLLLICLVPLGFVCMVTALLSRTAPSVSSIPPACRHVGKLQGTGLATVENGLDDAWGQQGQSVDAAEIKRD